MAEISIFVDESGGQGGHSKYYALTLVFHDQSCDIAGEIRKYRIGLRAKAVADVPMHAGPLMTGHDQYLNMAIEDRKYYLNQFFLLLQHLPVTYKTFLYRRSEIGDKNAFLNRMRRDITMLLFDNLDCFQSFEQIKVHYDNGQEIVAKALHEAIGYVIGRQSVLYRQTRATDFVLEQAADLLCTLELTAVKFENKEATRTDEKFFGSARAFKKNYLKAIKRKRIENRRQ